MKALEDIAKALSRASSPVSAGIHNCRRQICDHQLSRPAGCSNLDGEGGGVGGCPIDVEAVRDLGAES